MPLVPTDCITTLCIIPRARSVTPLFLNTLKPPPTVSALYSSSGTPLSNHYCYKQLYYQFRGRPLELLGARNWSGTIPYLLQSSSVGYFWGAVAPLPYLCFLTHSDGCSASLRGIGCRIARTWGGGLGAPLGYWCCPYPGFSDKMIVQTIPGGKGPCSTRKMEGAPLCCTR